MTKYIILLNAKGGCSKTTSTVTIAHGLARRGKSALVVDLDSQGQCATLLGMDQEPGIYDLLVKERKPGAVTKRTGRDKLFLIPGNHKTNSAQRLITFDQRPISDLRDRLENTGHDYVLFDTAPSITELTSMGIYAADHYLIPTAVDFLSTEGVFKVMKNIKSVQDNYHHEGELAGIMPTFYDTTNETAATLDDLNKNFPGAVLPAIHRATVMRESAAAGKTIFEFAPSSRAAKEYQVIIDHILEVA